MSRKKWAKVWSIWSGQGGAIRSECCYGALSLYTARVPRAFLVFIHSTVFFFSKISNLWNDLKEANLVTQSMHSLKLAKSQLNDQLFTMRLSNNHSLTFLGYSPGNLTNTISMVVSQFGKNIRDSERYRYNTSVHQ